jgi:hypothetical protein
VPLHVRLIFLGVVSGAVLGPALVAAQEQPPSAPCESDPVYHQFDFWVGEWDVLNPEGQQAGTNRIEKLLRGCLLVENWTSARGGAGKSINYYDPIRKRWAQTWVDGQGGIIAVEGTLEGGTMRFEGEHLYPDGRREAYRMSFTPQADGSVRQFIEQSRDGGATWYVWFDGTYVRKQD